MPFAISVRGALVSKKLWTFTPTVDRYLQHAFSRDISFRALLIPVKIFQRTRPLIKQEIDANNTMGAIFCRWYSEIMYCLLKRCPLKLRQRKSMHKLNFAALRIVIMQIFFPRAPLQWLTIVKVSAKRYTSIYGKYWNCSLLALTCIIQYDKLHIAEASDIALRRSKV